MKPDKELRKKYKTDYYDKTDFASKARLLQSIWRTENDFEFDKYGILKKKEFYDKSKMNKISFAKDITENELRKENFIYSFLSSVRQKMLTKSRK